MKKINYGMYTITGDRAEDAAAALDKEETRLEFFNLVMRPGENSYIDSRIAMYKKIEVDYNVTIK